MDALGLYVIFNSILIISGRWKGKYAIKCYLGNTKNLTCSGVRTQEPVIRSTNNSATQMIHTFIGVVWLYMADNSRNIQYCIQPN